MAQRVLFVHAHPDDETISTGGTIATLLERGAAVGVLTCTRGERGEVIPVALKHLEGTTELAAHRENELAAALADLGGPQHWFLGETPARWQDLEPRRYLDSGMSWGARGAQPSGTSDSGSLTAAPSGEVAADIAAAMIAFDPDVVVSYAADGGYGHPDHKRAHEATRTAAEVLGVAFYVIQPQGRAELEVDVTPVLERKRAALRAYATQVSVDGDTVTHPGGQTEPIGLTERFTRVRPPEPGFGDYSLASRIAACAAGLLLGAFAGATLTVAHQATIGGFPWGIVAAILITAALLVGMRLVFETRLVPGLAAIGLLGASAILALQTAGGSVLVPDNPAGYVWTFGPVVIALIVLAWPRLPARGA